MVVSPLARRMIPLSLAGCVGLCAFFMIGPFQGLEAKVVPWDKAAHFIAFYGITVLLYLSFPRRRRMELALIAALLGCGIEIVQRLTGRDASVGDMLANTSGAFAVYLPGLVERVRAAARSPGGLVERRVRRMPPALAGAPEPRASQRVVKVN